MLNTLPLGGDLLLSKRKSEFCYIQQLIGFDHGGWNNIRGEELKNERKSQTVLG